MSSELEGDSPVQAIQIERSSERPASDIPAEHRSQASEPARSNAEKSKSCQNSSRNPSSKQDSIQKSNPFQGPERRVSTHSQDENQPRSEAKGSIASSRLSGERSKSHPEITEYPGWILIQESSNPSDFHR
ncbi:hypothetical protein OS493_010783 [Desmophyllum pertusum]|uniref:Uncharacterized protein n=1 Tax=Desmophyllum pertusum TaxID=174260 RepID=A0A9W9ZEQ6_9CNID|nr:hypothetical protein OS493_010783 [Desmophyllum pertusum]